MARRLVGIASLIALVAAGTAFGQERPAAADTVVVLPEDHPLRPQKPPRPDLTFGERLLSGIGWLLTRPFEYTGTALEGTLIPIEEERGGFAAGLAATAARPSEPGHLSVMGGSIGTRSGFLGGGVRYDVFPRDEGPQLGFTAAATNRGYMQHTVFAGLNDPRERPYARVTGFYDLDAMDQFWGLGPDSDRDDETVFSWEKYGAIAAAGIPEGRIVWGRAYVGYEQSSVFRGREIHTVDLADLFPDAVFKDLELWGPGATVALDLRNRVGYPTSGLLVQGTGELWRSLGDEDLEWVRYGAEASAHLPLGSDWHVLSVMAGFDAVDPRGGTEEIPFAYLPVLGGSQSLRAYPGWRWRDRAAVYGTAEFRWRIWHEHVLPEHRDQAGALETALFYDVGQVGSELGDIDLGGDLKNSYGLIARFYLVGGHLMTFGAGHGDEGMRFVFSMRNLW